MPRVQANRSIRLPIKPCAIPPRPTRSLAGSQNSRLAAKAPATQEAPFRFLALPVEIRLLCYQYLLPTDAEPHLLVYNPLVDTQKQTFLSLWRTCKTIYNELPTISSLLSTGAIIPTVEVGRIKPLRAGTWAEGSFKRTSPAVWEPILKYLMPFLPKARFLHIRYPGLDSGWDPWLEGWKNSETTRNAMHQWLGVHADEFSETVDEDENEDAGGHQGKTLLLDHEIQIGRYLPYLYVSLLSQAISNLDAITLPKVELLEFYMGRDRECYDATLWWRNRVDMRDLERLKTMHKDFEAQGFQLFSVNTNEYGEFNGIIGKWSTDHRRFDQTSAVRMDLRGSAVRYHVVPDVAR